MALTFRRSRANSRSSSPGVGDDAQISHIDNYLRELTNPPAPNIDIVAIHGLNPGKAHHGEGTWSKNGVLWLEDERFLPRRFPNARILLFGYNSRVATGTSNAGVMDIAIALLSRLTTKRRDDPQRPIVFLCHSLGGIIVKQALVRAVHGIKYESIRWSTRAIAFFGTPHRGGNHAELGKILASIALFLTGSVKNNFMETLQKNSTSAANIHELFKEHAQEYRIVSFYETLPLTPHFGVIVDKVSATLGLPDSMETIIPVAANHSDICKFDMIDPTYELVIENIADLVQHALQSPRIGLTLLTPTVSLTDPENRQRTLSVGSIQSTGSFDQSDSARSSWCSSGQHGMPTFQDIEADKSHSTTATSSTSTSPVIILPYSSNPNFIGRNKLFNTVQDSLGSTTTGQRRVALYGLGGVGKSQIAIRYAYWYRQKFPDHSVFWIHCGTADRFRQGLINVGTQCQVAGIADREKDQLLLLKDWLQRKTDFKWLMVLDNADDPTIFRGGQDPGESSQLQTDLSSYIPDCEHGSILITTRDLIVGNRLAKHRSPLQVNKMSPEEAVMMLKTRLSTGGEASPITPPTPTLYQQPVSDTDLLRLAQSLDYLPLAMVQAAGFITEFAISTDYYMKLFEVDASAVRLLEHTVEESGRDSDIPRSVYLPHYSGHHVGHDIVEFTTTIGVLLRFSLIVSGRDATYNMHRLVQLIVKQWLAASGAAAEWQSKALRLLSRQFPSGEFETWVECASLESHAVKMTHAPSIQVSDRSFLGTLQINLAWYYFNRGRWSCAKEYARAACSTFEEAYGLRHRETLAAKTKFAHILMQNSNLEEAEGVIQQALDESTALFDRQDQQYLITLDLFALIAQNRGRLAVAEKASRTVLSGLEKVFGPQHLSVFRSQRRLATILEFSGRYEEAEACIISALNGLKNLIGTTHKTTLQVMQRLVFIQSAQGKYVEAEKTAGEYLKVMTATYGSKHIGSHEARYTFARTLILNNKIEEAERILLNLIETIEKEHPFGPDHQYNFYMQNALGSIRMIQGRHLEASKLHSTAWHGIQKTYGKHHAKSYEYQSAYAAALTLANASEPDGAIFLQRQAYDGLKGVVGEEHPSTLTALFRLSEAHATRQELVLALKLAEQVLRGRENMLNINHPDTLAARKRVTELQALQHETKGAKIDLDKTDRGSSEKKKKKKEKKKTSPFFGWRSPASSHATPVETGSHANGALTEKEKTAHVATKELEKTDRYDLANGEWKSSLGLFGKYLLDGGPDEEIIKVKEIELKMASDISDDDDGTGEDLVDKEKSAAFTNNPPPSMPPPMPPQSAVDTESDATTLVSKDDDPKNNAGPPPLSPPPLPPRPAVNTQSEATAQASKERNAKHGACMENSSQTVQQEDTIGSTTVQLMRRKRVASRPSSDRELRQPAESKPDISELPAEIVVNPAARLDGPGWDDSPFGT